MEPGGAVAAGDLLYLAPHGWATIKQRPQHLAEALAAAGWRVLYVEPVAHSVAGQVRRVATGQAAEPWRGRVERRCERLWTYTPPPVLPLTLQSTTLNRLAHRLVARRLRNIQRAIGLDAPTLVVGWPPAGELVGQLGERVVVYDCMDNFRAIPQSARRRRVLVRTEMALACHAACIVATSAALVEAWRVRGYDALLIPNGVADAFLDAAIDPPIPPEMAALRAPRLVYTGAIDHRLDLGMLAAVLRARPDWSLALIGPVRTEIAPLAALPNVHQLGPRPHAALPGYLAAADACLIPFARSPFTDAVNPVKVYEYLAAGTPIVATPLPELAPFRAVCYGGVGADAFRRAIEQAIAEGRDDPRREGRRRLARRETWQRRAAALAALLADLPGNGGGA